MCEGNEIKMVLDILSEMRKEFSELYKREEEWRAKMVQMCEIHRGGLWDAINKMRIKHVEVVEQIRPVLGVWEQTKLRVVNAIINGVGTIILLGLAFLLANQLFGVTLVKGVVQP